MKFWKAQLKDGTWTDENEQKWDNIKNDVINLQLCINDQIISLPSNADIYIQGKTASGNLANGKVTIESRFIGFCLRSNIVSKDTITKIRVNEETNNITIETT
jgi:hypothetical protein